PALYEQGATAIVVPDQRWLRCDIKSINLLPNALAKEHARRAGALEALFDREGTGITEGASSNVFIVQDGALVTAPAGPFILRGVTRDLIIELAREAGLPVVERFFSRAELLAADEVFLTGTMTEVMPVVRVDGQVIGGGVPGPVTRRMHALLKSITPKAEV
ncbi:MAG TPA: aminotransferase class IV, partial [Limnochordales bacterium]